MPGQVAYSPAQDCNLHLCGSGIRWVSPVLFNNLGLGLPIQTASAVGYRRSSVLCLLCFHPSIAEHTGAGFTRERYVPY